MKVSLEDLEIHIPNDSNDSIRNSILIFEQFTAVQRGVPAWVIVEMGSSQGPTEAITSQQARERERHRVQRQLGHGEQEHPTVPTSNDGSTSPDFLRIVPCNTRAKLAFSELIEKKKSHELHEHHAQHLVDCGRGPLEKTYALHYKSSDETEDEDWSEGSENREVNLGYFRVNFDCPSLTKTAKWVLGKGSGQKYGTANRNVDILLAVPRSQYTSGILASHAFLKMHPESGVWMIFAAIGTTQKSEDYGSSSSPKATVRLDEEKVLSEGFRCLSKLQTPLEIQGLQFTVQFALDTLEAAQSYQKLRDKFLQDQDIQPPRCQISGIPLGSDIRVGNLAILSLGLGYGTFGSVYEGFSPINGDLRAVKVIEVRKKEDGESLRPELTIGQKFGDSIGLIRQYGWHNSNGDTTLEVAIFPIKIYLVMDLGLAFHEHDWNRYGSKRSRLELRLCQQLLQGLATMHSAGYMHRDITRQNILFIEAQPQRSQLERAALCDFGKVYLGKSDTDTRLAAWASLPPEIVEGKHYGYNHKIDIWMLALALVLCWYPHAVKNVPRRRNRQITSEGIETIRARLHKESNSGLPHLLRLMLAVEDIYRPPASTALTHPCFRNIPAEPAEDESGDVKRKKIASEEEAWLRQVDTQE